MIDFSALDNDFSQKKIIDPIEIFREMPKPLGFNDLYRALLHKDLKCKAPLIEPNLRRNLGKWAT